MAKVAKKEEEKKEEKKSAFFLPFRHSVVPSVSDVMLLLFIIFKHFASQRKRNVCLALCCVCSGDVRLNHSDAGIWDFCRSFGEKWTSLIVCSWMIGTTAAGR